MDTTNIALELAEIGLIANASFDKKEVLFARTEGTKGADFEGWKTEWNMATCIGETFFKTNAPSGRICKHSKKKWLVEIIQAGAPESRYWLYELTSSPEEAITLVVNMYFGNNELRKTVSVPKESLCL